MNLSEARLAKKGLGDPSKPRPPQKSLSGPTSRKFLIPADSFPLLNGERKVHDHP